MLMAESTTAPHFLYVKYVEGLQTSQAGQRDEGLGRAVCLFECRFVTSSCHCAVDIPLHVKV